MDIKSFSVIKLNKRTGKRSDIPVEQGRMNVYSLHDLLAAGEELRIVIVDKSDETTVLRLV